MLGAPPDLLLYFLLTFVVLLTVRLLLHVPEKRREEAVH